MEPDEPPRFRRIAWQGTESALFVDFEDPEAKDSFTAKPADSEWWSVRGDDGWLRLERTGPFGSPPFQGALVAVRFGRAAGRYVVTGLYLETDGDAITSRMLRSLPLGDIARSFEAIPSALASLPPLADEPKRPGRRKRSPEFYVDVVRWYREALLRAPTRPVQWLASRAGPVNPSTVHRWLKTAEELGLLDDIKDTTPVKPVPFDPPSMTTADKPRRRKS
jgi:transposase-like protein